MGDYSRDGMHASPCKRNAFNYELLLSLVLDGSHMEMMCHSGAKYRAHACCSSVNLTCSAIIICYSGKVPRPFSYKGLPGGAGPSAVLISGGTGALGCLVATWLALYFSDRRELLLLGRSGRALPAASQVTMPLLSCRGGPLQTMLCFASCDVATQDNAHAAGQRYGCCSALPFGCFIHAGVKAHRRG